MFEREYRELSFVPRWGIARRLREQNVAEHSYYVCLYSKQIMDYLGLSNEHQLEVLSYAIIHDLPEALFGDWMGPAKHMVVDKHRMEACEQSVLSSRFGLHKVEPSKLSVLVVKFADRMDEVLWVATEIQLGNQSLGTFHPSSVNRIVEGTRLSIADSVMKGLIQAWENLCEGTGLLNEAEMHKTWRDIIWIKVMSNLWSISNSIHVGEQP